MSQTEMKPEIVPEENPPKNQSDSDQKESELTPIARRAKRIKVPKGLNRNLNRFFIQATTDTGLKLYYVDDIIVWSLSKFAAMQIYGEPYAVRYAKRVYEDWKNRLPKSRRKIVKIQIRKVPDHFLNELFYMENVLGSELHFLRAYSVKRSEVKEKDRIRKENRIRKTPYEELNEVEKKILDNIKLKEKKANIAGHKIRKARRGL